MKFQLPLLEVRRAPLSTRSVCRVSFKSFVFGTRPVESMPNSAGQPLVQRSTRVKGQRFVCTGLGRMVHVLDGSGGCGIRPDEGREATLEPKGSGGREDVL